MSDNAVLSIMRLIARMVTTLAFDLKVYGIHHVPANGGVMIVSNHQSNIDPPAIGCQIPRMTHYLAKSELFKTRFSNWINRQMGAFPVRMGEGDIGAIRESIRRLKEGSALVLFPEGSRTWQGDLQKLQPGVGLIAKKAGVPIVPCVIDGSYKAWPRTSKLFRRWPVRVQFGPAIDIGHLKAAAIVELLDETFHRMLSELRAEVRAENEAGVRLVLSRRFPPAGNGTHDHP